jgi:flagellar P-ring protein precursor FlgI
MAQGNLIVGGLGVDGADGSKLSVNIPSAGRISGGASVERAVDTGFAMSENLIFNLSQFDISNAGLVAAVINQRFGSGTAQAIDGTSIRINTPVGGENRIRMMGVIENLEIQRAAPPARRTQARRTQGASKSHEARCRCPRACLAASTHAASCERRQNHHRARRR